MELIHSLMEKRRKPGKHFGVCHGEFWRDGGKYWFDGVSEMVMEERGRTR